MPKFTKIDPEKNVRGGGKMTKDEFWQEVMKIKQQRERKKILEKQKQGKIEHMRKVRAAYCDQKINKIEKLLNKLQNKKNKSEEIARLENEKNELKKEFKELIKTF